MHFLMLKKKVCRIIRDNACDGEAAGRKEGHHFFNASMHWRSSGDSTRFSGFAKKQTKSKD
jgi:hypothetical protein